MKVHKIADFVLSSHPLYSIVSAGEGKFLFAGGLDPFIFRLSSEVLSGILGPQTRGSGSSPEAKTLSSQDIAEPGKIKGLKTTVYIQSEDTQKENIWVGGGSGILQIFNLSSLKLDEGLPLGSPIFALNLLKDRALVGLGNGVLKILDIPKPELPGMEDSLKTDSLPSREIQISNQALRVIERNPKQAQIALSGKDCIIRVLDADSYNLQYQMEGHTFPVFSLSYSPEGRYLYSGSRDASIKIWSTENYSLVKTIPAHLFAINQILFHPHKPYFLSASMDKSIKIWGSDDFQLYKILNAERNGGHTSSVNRMAWVGVDHPILVSVSDDRRMIFWDIEF